MFVDELFIAIAGLQAGRLAVAKVTKDYLVCAYGDTTTQFGALKSKVNSSVCAYNTISE